MVVAKRANLEVSKQFPPVTEYNFILFILLKKKQSLNLCFCKKEQLNKLMKTLDATYPHFVRCIIPNEIKTGGFNKKNIDFLKFLINNNFL